MNSQHITENIAQAAKVIGKTWPLYSFVTSNPLTGYEQKPFIEAVQQANRLLGARVFPEAAVFATALTQGQIDREVLLKMLTTHHCHDTPEDYLKFFAENGASRVQNENHQLDCIMSKWLAAFMDEGLAEWEMPFKERGFYGAWRALARYDKTLGIANNTTIPETSMQALKEVLAHYPEDQHKDIFTYHLAALPGWTGYLNHRIAAGTAWQEQFPVSMEDYLAIRLFVGLQLGTPIVPKQTAHPADGQLLKLQHLWLQAWEASWQNKLLKNLLQNHTTKPEDCTPQVADAQLVFCIDTRSELIRRHVEAQGAYETFGYAGFFGIAMDYKSLEDGITRKSCPPIVGSAYTITEQAQQNKQEALTQFTHKITTKHFQNFFLNRMKGMLPSAFGYVEGTGLFYGASLFSKTIMPGRLYKKQQQKRQGHEHFCEPTINPAACADTSSTAIPLAEKVSIVKAAFDLTGWMVFAPIIVFAGHGSHSTNNPFGSSLDCGACAASPGRHNARMLATLANLPEVREVLRHEYGYDIPNDTIFIGAEHNTTTDEIVLFDSQVPARCQALMTTLKKHLAQAQRTACQERLEVTKNSIDEAEYKAGNWGETRPEWGLAKNAGFIVGPRSLTKNINLESRCFLHSYDWQQDPNGQALEGIMQGPMVVTQWINNHYYFSTVDNDTFGSGSKITHNITGGYGVVQGNGGDLKMGLPLQSLQETDVQVYHEPLRLTVVIQAPRARVTDILTRNTNLQMMLDNQWIYLFIIDPTDGFKKTQYQYGISWN